MRSEWEEECQPFEVSASDSRMDRRWSAVIPDGTPATPRFERRMFREKPSPSSSRETRLEHLLGLGPVAPLASLTDHEEQATCSSSLGTTSSRRQLASGHTLRLSLPNEQHHHPVHVDDGDDWPANRAKHVPGFRSTKTPTHRGQTSQTEASFCKRCLL